MWKCILLKDINKQNILRNLFKMPERTKVQLYTSLNQDYIIRKCKNISHVSFQFIFEHREDMAQLQKQNELHI